MNADELLETKRLWLKTGLRDSILTTADHAASVQSHGVAADSLRRTADQGLIFYRAGELFNRRTSFLTALDEFRKKNPNKVVSDADLKQILSRSNDFMLNLSKANKAAWQKGLLGLPTQFLQVNAKTAESLLGANVSFTSGERARLLFGQLALYGSAGIPMGTLAGRWIGEQVYGDQQGIEDADPSVIAAINQGFWGWLAMTAFGADIDMSKRGAIASGLETFMFDTLFAEQPVTERIFGAFGEVPHRFYTAWKTIKPYAFSVYADKRFPETSELMIAARSLGSILSTVKQFDKALMMHEFNLLLDRNGYPIANKDFNLSTEIATAIGAQPAVAGRVRDMNAMVKDVEKHKKNVVNALIATYWNYSREVEGINQNNPEELDELVNRYEGINALLIQSLRTPNDQTDVLRSLQNRIMKGKTKEEQAIRKFLKTFADGRVNDLTTIHSSFSTRALIETLPNEENE